MADSTLVAPEQLLEDRLDRIRKQKTSKLQNQKHLALILEAVDESLDENNDEKTPTAYFVSFLSLMDQSISTEKIENKEMAITTTYFLDLVAPYVSAGLLKAKFEQILQKILPALENEQAEAPLLRSSIGTLESVLLAQDLQCWQRPVTDVSPKSGLIRMIHMGMDPRPKVRKRAQEAVTKILSNPPPSPRLEHPGSDLCADISMSTLSRAIKESQKHKDNAKMIHALQVVESVTNANGWPSEKIEILCESLLQICKTNEQFLISAAFKVFEAVFKSITDEMGAPKLVKILDTILDLLPSHNDVHIAPAWLAVVAQAGESYASLQPQRAFARLPTIFQTVSEFLESENENIKVSASQCMVALATTAIPNQVLLQSHKSKKTEKTLQEICATVFKLLHIKYIGTWNETMEVLSSLFDKLRWRADPHLVNALKVVGALRSEEKFADGREAADKAIAAAIRALGPETVLSHLPLNLENDHEDSGRTWMLPLLRENIQFANLGHFVRELVPLGERLNQRAQQLREEGGEKKQVLAKTYETLNDQIWSLLPRYMDLPFDLQTAFDDNFAQSLAASLYEDPEKRPSVCQSLRLLIQSNTIYANAEIDQDELLLERFPVENAQSNVEFLANQFALKTIKVLFNVFMSTPENARAYVRECIETWLNITPEADVVSMFNSVSGALMGEIKTESKASKYDHAMMKSYMDIIITMTRFLPQQSFDALARIFTTMVAREDNAQLQKRAFRILVKMSNTDNGVAYLTANVSALEQVFVEYRKKVAREARGLRLQAVGEIVKVLPSDHLSFVASLLPETVISTKDQNHETRENAYALLVQMGDKMKVGGSVDQSQIPDVDDDDAPVTQATLEEYFTMLSAGLAGDTPHMISATVTALSRVVFEFRDELTVEFLEQLSNTVQVFLEHNSREIVKSALGFVKIAAISLPMEIVEPQLKDLLEHMLVWARKSSEGGKGEFKNKIKHIIDRMMRRFGYDKIAAAFPEDDLKLLTNIRKTKERAKRNKKEGTEVDSHKPKKYDNEFDQALYGDEEDDDDEESEDEGVKNKGDRYIVEGEDEPMDLLDQKSLANISSTRPKNNKQAGKQPALKNKFSKDDSGKMVIKDQDKDEVDDDQLDLKDGIDAYVQAIKNGPVKGNKNRFKYKRGRNDEESDGGESDDEPVSKSKKPQSFGKGNKPQHNNRAKKQQPKRRKL